MKRISRWCDLRLRHALPRMLFSEDESKLITAAVDGSIITWDAATGRSINTVKLPVAEGVGYLAVGASELVVAGGGRSLGLWSLAESEFVWRKQELRAVPALLMMSANRTRFAMDLAGERTVLATATGEVLGKVKASHQRRRLKLCHDLSCYVEVATLSYPRPPPPPPPPPPGVPFPPPATPRPLPRRDCHNPCPPRLPHCCSREPPPPVPHFLNRCSFETGQCSTLMPLRHPLPSAMAIRGEVVVVAGERLQVVRATIGVVEQIPGAMRPRAVLISPDGLHAVTTGLQGVAAWDLNEGVQLWKTPYLEPQLKLSRDGRYVIGSGEPLVMWDLVTGVEVFRAESHVLASNAVLATRKPWIAYSESKESIVVADRLSGAPQVSGRRGHSGSVTVIASDASGNMIASADASQRILLWDRHGQQRELRGNPTLRRRGNELRQMALTADGRLITLHEEGDRRWVARVWDVASNMLRRTMMPEARVYRAALLPGNRRILFEDGDGITLWSVATGLKAVGQPPWGVTAAADTDIPFSLGAARRHNGFVFNEQLADILVANRKDSAMVAATVTADRQRLLSTNYTGVVRLWDVGTATVLAELTREQSGYPAVAFSPDGGLAVATVGDGEVWIWLTANPTVPTKVKLEEPLEQPSAVAFSALGDTLIVGTNKGRILRFKLEVAAAVNPPPGGTRWRRTQQPD